MESNGRRAGGDSAPLPPLHVARPPDVVVVGAGLIGLACGRELSRRGLRVEILEGHALDSGASAAAAGMLSPLGEATPDTAFGRLCLRARDGWAAWSRDLTSTSGIDPGYDDTPALFADEPGAESSSFLDTIAAQARAAGIEATWLEGDAVREHCRVVAGSIRRALLVPGEHRVDPRRVLQALRVDLARRGVMIHVGRPVERVEPEDETVVLVGRHWRVRAPCVVLACGAWTGSLEGVPLPEVTPVRGQLIRYDGLDWAWSGSLRLARGYAVRRGDSLLVGTTEEDVGFDQGVTEEARVHLAKTAVSLFPSLQWRRVSKHWSGLRPATIDRLPVVGAVPGSGGRRVILATGHFRNGILLAPWTAGVVSDLVVDGESSDLPPDFRPEERVREAPVSPVY